MVSVVSALCIQTLPIKSQSKDKYFNGPKN